MSVTTNEKNNKKVINAWCMYDWANSVYSLTITTAIFPGYYQAITQEKVTFLGFEFVNTALYSFSLSFAFIAAAFLSPMLTSIADYTGKKKRFMQLFCYLGSLACALLFFFTPDEGAKYVSEFVLTVSVIVFIIAGMGFSGSIVFYNSFLPEIASEDRMDKVSAKGFAFGYIGSVLLLLINLSMILFPDVFYNLGGKIKEFQSLNPNLPFKEVQQQAIDHFALLSSRIAFLSVGIWWFLFAQYTFYYLPSNVYKKEGKGNWILNGFKELNKVFNEIKTQSILKRFLLAFFFYNLGVQTVMYMATIFGKAELKLEMTELIVVVLIIQIIAIFGAQIFARISGAYGNIKALMIIISIWVLVCGAAFFVRNNIDFYMLAVVVGFVMGGVQSMSRSTYAKLIPQHTTDHASYFSFYDVADKVSTFAGTAIFGLITTLTGGMRPSTLTLGVFFIIGLIFLTGIPSLKSYSLKKVA
jgi:MFS transporter, UMF1 family